MGCAQVFLADLHYLFLFWQKPDLQDFYKHVLKNINLCIELEFNFD